MKRSSSLCIGFIRRMMYFNTVALFALSSYANGALILTRGSGPAGTMEISSSISFPITAAGQAQFIVFVGLQSAGIPSGIVYSSDASNQYPLTFQKVGEGPVFMGFQMDSASNELGDGELMMTPNLVAVPSVLPGDVVIIGSAAMTVGFIGFDPPPGSFYYFDGSAFLADAHGNRLSEIVSIPEPATNCSIAIGVCLLASRRSRTGRHY